MSERRGKYGVAKRKSREEDIQITLSIYIHLQYPDVIFTSESSGVRVSMGTAVKMKKQRSAGKLPDMIILEPRIEPLSNIYYHGMCLELKKGRDEIYTKKGELRETEHILAQSEMLDRLREKGYWAEFVCGFDEAKMVVDNYLNYKA